MINHSASSCPLWVSAPKRRWLFFAGFLLLAPAVFAGFGEEWRVSSYGDGATEARPGSGFWGSSKGSIAVDAVGNVWVTGYAINGGNKDYLTVSYAPDGTERFRRTVNGAGNSDDYATAVAVDAVGNAWVTGTALTASGNYDYLTVSYAADGTERFRMTMNGIGDGDDDAVAVAVDADGNAWVTGQAVNDSGNLDYLTVSYAPDGTERFRRSVNGAENWYDYAIALAVDANGNAWVTGQSWNGSSWSSGQWEYRTVSYEPDGTERFRRIVDGTGSDGDVVKDLAVDADGNACVTGLSTNASNDDYLTVCYGPDGTERFRKTMNGLGDSFDQANSVAIDFDGNAWVTGFSGNASGNYDYLTVSYAPDGTERFQQSVNGTGDGDDEANAIAVDADGNAWVTGYSDNGSNDDFLTVSYAPDGSERFRQSVSGEAHGNDQAYAVAVDAAGNAIVTGTGNNFGVDGFLTVKYGPDTDIDGVADVIDNCPLTANAGQDNADMDPLGDVCDPEVSVFPIATPASLNEPGGTVAIILGVSNAGSVELTLTALADDVYGNLNGVGTCSVPQTIPVLSTYSCFFGVTITGGAGDSVSNTVTASVTEVNEDNSTTESGSTTVTLIDVLFSSGFEDADFTPI